IMRKLGAVIFLFLLFGAAIASASDAAVPKFTDHTYASYPVGSAPASMVVGDFNQDGVPDVAVASSTTGALTIYYGQLSPNLGLGNMVTVSLAQTSGSPVALNVVGQRTLDANLQISAPQLLGATNDRNIFAVIPDGLGGFTTPA